MRITEVSIRQIPFSEGKQIKVRDRALPGFGLIVGKRTKTFFVMFGERRHTRTLGRYPDLSLKDARAAARKLLASPPTVTRSVSFSAARSMFLEDCTARLRKSTSDRYFYALKDITAAKLDSVDANVNDPTTLKTLKAFYNWCIDNNYTDRNPFARKKVVFPIRDRLLTDDEIATIWSYTHPPYSDIVKLLILTGQRRNQIWKFEPGWMKDDVMTFPASVMKSNKAHTIPVMGYSKYLPEHPYSFNSWSKSKLRLNRFAPVDGWVLHDLRRYFSSTMARLGVPLHVTEQIIDHRSQISGVAAIYNLHTFLPEMREALALFDAHILRITNIPNS